MRFLLALVLALASSPALALETARQFSIDAPNSYKRGQPVLPILKGTTDDEVYVMEVDTVSGGIPVAIVSGGSSVSHTYAYSAYNDYGGTNVTTGAWVQLVASTAAASTVMTLADTCGEVLELGTGAAASETRVMLIPRGGIDGQFALNIPSGTRISIRAVSGNCTGAGTEIALTGFQ